MEKKILIISHKEDNDGIFSAAIIKNFLVNEKKISEDRFVLNLIDYNEAPKTFKHVIETSDEYSEVYISDISFAPDSMKMLYEIFGDKLTWFDHHKPIIEKSVEMHFDGIKGIRQSDKSALLNAYIYFYGENNIPKLFTYLSLWDSWTYGKKDRDFIMSINEGVNLEYKLNFDSIYALVGNIINSYNGKIMSSDMNFTLFNSTTLDSGIIADMKAKGENVIKYRNNHFEKILREFGDYSWKIKTENGYRTACALFLQEHTNSIIFESVSDKVQNGIVFKRLPDSNWALSLYNTNDNDIFHCGTFCQKAYNGGGHKGAAGAVLTERQMFNLLSTKTLK